MDPGAGHVGMGVVIQPCTKACRMISVWNNTWKKKECPGKKGGGVPSSNQSEKISKLDIFPLQSKGVVIVNSVNPT